MNLPNRDVFSEMEDVLTRMDKEWTGFLSHGVREPTSFHDWFPNVDVKENSNRYEVKAELPGVNKEDISVQIENDVLSISGKKKSKSVKNNEKSHRIECSYGSFFRCFSLPGEVNLEKSSAKFKNGILTLKLAKSDQQKQKQLEIKIE